MNGDANNRKAGLRNFCPGVDTDCDKQHGRSCFRKFAWTFFRMANMNNFLTLAQISSFAPLFEPQVGLEKELYVFKCQKKF